MDIPFHQSDSLTSDIQTTHTQSVKDLLYDPDEHVLIGDEREHRQITWSRYNGSEGFQLLFKRKKRRLVRNFAFTSRHGLNIGPTVSYNSIGCQIDIIALEQPMALKDARDLLTRIKPLLHGHGQVLDPGCFAPAPAFEGGSGKRISQAVMMHRLESVGV